MGTVIDTYIGYKNVNLNIGSGGFGNVYEFSDKRAVKEEFKVRMLSFCGNVLICMYLATADY